ncbi:hypothetical protein QBC32DRAFT_370791 [Pseudoneurospora amorphoporcata]|uniref:Uncharacterized protein n=1 Tax=Pseudoneurospora amorphoporcata TaxID=241081 RepID=A0AAN6NTP4_9PEZI|nr:hypothetical protein QBC32DRAFT_370791 [Pseudoneurospora amorphoporcata]
MGKGYAPEDRKRLHCWAAIGYNFKSELIWYDSGNANGKMTLQCYRDQILEPVVGEWLRKGEDFVLEEDNDSEENGLEHYFNCSCSPDFTPIEKAWQSPKQYLRKRPCWDDTIVKELAEEGWAALTQERINSWIDSIPQILKDCIELEGAMTGH